MSEKLKCYGCRNLHLKGSGYSDWTWTSTWFVCTKGRFEEVHDEPEAAERGVIEIASKDCPFFEAGEPVETSPDGDVLKGDINKAKELGYDPEREA